MKRSAPLQSMTAQMAVKYSKSHSAHQLLSSLAAVAEAASNLERVAVTKSPNHNPVAHAAMVKDRAKSYQSFIEASERQIRQSAKDSLAKIHDDIRTRAKLQPSIHAAETRGVFRIMPKSDQLEVLRVAVENRDHTLLADLSEGNVLTTGINKTVLDEHIESYLNAVVPDLIEAREALTDIMGSVPTYFATASKVPESVVDERAIERLIQDEASSRQAQMEFSANMRDGLDPLIA
jgi:hypothetical protein